LAISFNTYAQHAVKKEVDHEFAWIEDKKHFKEGSGLTFDLWMQNQIGCIART
jgi:hypothetical protein